MPKIHFYPLDIVYKIINEKAHIYLFGRTLDNKQIVVKDSNFQPYFYVELKDKNVTKRFQELLPDLFKNKEEKVLKSEIVKKQHLGKEIEVIKIYPKLPMHVPIIAKEIKELEITKCIYESDILFVRRYLIDKEITPLALTEAKGEFITEDFKAPVLNASNIHNISNDILKKPKILAIDIETYNPLGKGGVNPEKYPIVMIAFASEKFKKVITWKPFKTDLDYVEFTKSEADLLVKFKEIIDKQKPDIIAGYFSDGFDLPYINTRAEKYNLQLKLGLDRSEMQIKKMGNKAVFVTGITHLDIFKFIKRVMGRTLQTDSFKLDNVAEEILGEKKHEIDLDNLAEVWDDHPEKLEPYCAYNLQDAELTLKLCNSTFPMIIEFTKITGLPINDLTRMSFSQLDEWFIIKQAKQFDELIPNSPDYHKVKERTMQTYQGAFVFEPKAGLYDDIVVFDFRSLYPTIISSHNIGPGSFRCECCPDNTVPSEEKQYWFCKNKKGFIPTIIERLITRRIRVKEILKNDPDNIMLKARSEALKLLANSFYGYLGFPNARFYSFESAKSVTAYGRHYIQDVIKKAEEKGFEILYSDTDSIFLTLKDKKPEDANKFIDNINSKLPGLMELDLEGFYPKGLFVSAKMGTTGAKKRYALLDQNNKLKIRGFEMVRRNVSFIAKETQKEVLNIILKENNPEKALNYAKDIIKQIKNKETELEKLIINTQLTKSLDSYESIGPHVAVARRMKNNGDDVGPGSIIQYIVTEGEGRIRDRAKLPEEIKNHNYDSDYYINNQVIPAIEKIFEVLGYTKEELLSKQQSKLGEFF